MMKIILAIFLLPVLVLSQPAIIDFNQLELREGLFFIKKTSILFTGWAKKLDIEENVLEEIYIFEGYLDGEWLFFNSNGDQIGEGRFERGSGTYRLFHNFSKKTVLEETSYKNNLLHGKSIRYDENGVKVSEISYMYGKISGKKCIWNENGRLYLEQDWENDRIHGLWREWYPTGEKEAFGEFINGDGKLIRFYKKGRKKSVCHYKNNLENGKRVIWHENGKRAHIDWFKNGKQCGESFEWDENGRPIKKEWE